MICSIEDCYRDAITRGWCSKHYQRWRTTGNPNDVVPPGQRRNARKPPPISEADLAWLAGLLEGEGTFFMQKGHKNGVCYQYPIIVVSMTDEDVIDRVAYLFGTSSHKESQRYYADLGVSRKPSWRASAAGTRAVSLMQSLLPWMGKRRGEKIKELLKTQYGRMDN